MLNVLLHFTRKKKQKNKKTLYKYISKIWLEARFKLIHTVLRWSDVNLDAA